VKIVDTQIKILSVSGRSTWFKAVSRGARFSRRVEPPPLVDLSTDSDDVALYEQFDAV